MKVQPVTVDDCIRLIRSNRKPEMIIEMLKYLFSDPINFKTYCRFIFPDAFSRPFAECHKHIINFLFADGNGAQAQPRGFGKSTTTGLGYISWCIAYATDRYIVYTSENHPKSEQFLEPIKTAIESNKNYNRIFGPFNVGKAHDKLGRERSDCFDVNGMRIQAISYERSIRGLKYGNYRPTLIILDDIENDQRVLNPILRKKDKNKLNKQIIPSMDVDVGRYKFIGTILHFDSLLMNKIKLNKGNIIKAENEKGESNFPDLFSIEKLMAIKREIGPLSYQQEYLNEPVADETSIIKSEWVRACFDEELSYEDKGDFSMKTLGHDPSFSDSLTADNTAICGIGMSNYRTVEDGKFSGKYVIFLAEWLRGKSITEQLVILNEYHRTFRFNYLGLEENSIRAVSDDFKRTIKFPYKLFWLGNTSPQAQRPSGAQYREWTDKRITIGKMNMVQRMGTRFWNKEIKLPYKTEEDKEKSNRILEECVTWSIQDGKLVEAGIHPDMPIALAYAIELMEMHNEVYVGDLDLGF